MRALVVEDLDRKRRRVNSTLQEAGIEVDLAHNSAEGLQLSRESRYVAVIVDLGLDDLPNEPTVGLDLVKKLRKEVHDVPILIWSGFNDWESRLESRRVGADAYVAKSTDMTKLVAVLVSIVDSAR